MSRVGVLARRDSVTTRCVVERAVMHLRARGCEVVAERGTSTMVPQLRLPPADDDNLARVDFLLALGGDGTVLRAAHTVGRFGTPILGVNLGSLGFLTATPHQLLLPVLDAALLGDVVVQDRMMLRAAVRRHGYQADQKFAVNEATLATEPRSPLKLKVEVEGTTVVDYEGDGMIVSTPTGSTAYSLSVGGPILFPTMEAFVLAFICPASVILRPLVVPAGLRVALRVLDAGAVAWAMDGQSCGSLQPADVVEIDRSAMRLRLMRMAGEEPFSVLRAKLRWGEPLVSGSERICPAARTA